MSAERDIRSDAAADRLLEQTWRQRRRRLPAPRTAQRARGQRAVRCGRLRPAVARRSAGRLRPRRRGRAAGDLRDPGRHRVSGRRRQRAAHAARADARCSCCSLPAAVPLLVAAALLAARLLDWLRGRGSLDRLLFSDARRLARDRAGRRAGRRRRPAAAIPPTSRWSSPRCSPAACSTPARATLREARVARRRADTPAAGRSRPSGSSTRAWRRSASSPPTAPATTSPPCCSSSRSPGCCCLLARDRQPAGSNRPSIVSRWRYASAGRLQLAVRRMGDAFAAKLDIDAIVDIMLRGSIEALDADAGCLQLARPEPRRLPEPARPTIFRPCAARGARRGRGDRPAEQIELRRPDARWRCRSRSRSAEVHRRGGPSRAGTRPFQADEVDAARASSSARRRPRSAEILGHHALREEAVSRDPLTGLGNRRKLAADRRRVAARRRRLDRACSCSSTSTASRATTTRSAISRATRCSSRLGREAQRGGGAARRAPTARRRRVLRRARVDADRVEEIIAIAAEALSETGEEFSVTRRLRRGSAAARGRHASNTPCSSPTSACTRTSTAGRRTRGEQTHDVLMRDHARQAARRCMSTPASVAELAGRRRPPLRHDRRGDRRGRPRRRAARRRQGRHPRRDPRQARPARRATSGSSCASTRILGERILNAAATLRPVARLVRSSHERWDGTGYPDRPRGRPRSRSARASSPSATPTRP